MTGWEHVDEGSMQGNRGGEEDDWGDRPASVDVGASIARSKGEAPLKRPRKRAEWAHR